MIPLFPVLVVGECEEGLDGIQSQSGNDERVDEEEEDVLAKHALQSGGLAMVTFIIGANLPIGGNERMKGERSFIGAYID